MTSPNQDRNRIPNEFTKVGLFRESLPKRGRPFVRGFFDGVHVNHVDGLWLGSPKERTIAQQQNRSNIGGSFPV